MTVERPSQPYTPSALFVNKPAMSANKAAKFALETAPRMKPKVQLPAVEADDLALFFENQRDPVAVAMVAYRGSAIQRRRFCARSSHAFLSRFLCRAASANRTEFVAV